MPTSWSIDAAHSSSRSPVRGSNRPPSTSESNICSASLGDVLDVRHVRLVLDREVAHGGLADVVEQRLAVGEQRAREEHAVAQAGLGGLDPVEAAELEHGLERDAPRRG